MIVADTNLVAYLLIGGMYTEAAEKALRKDPVWVAPPLWKHEFPDVVATSVREGKLTQPRAEVVLAEAPVYVRSYDHDRPLEVLRLAIDYRIPTYDCEFVVLARHLLVQFVTADKELLRLFPDVAIGINSLSRSE